MNAEDVKMAVVEKTKPAIPKLPRRKPRKKPSLAALCEEIAALGRMIPPEDLAKIPRDGSINLDHYLYGKPKVEP